MAKKTYGSYLSTNLEKNSIITERLLYKKTLLEKKKVVIFELPEGAIPFTLLLKWEEEKETGKLKKTNWVYSKDPNLVIDRASSDVFTFSSKLGVFLGNLEFNTLGYMLLDDVAKKYKVEDGTCFIYDIYVNGQYVDYPLYKKFVKRYNEKLSLPALAEGAQFIFEDFKNYMKNKKSHINPELPLNSFIIKPFIESLEGSSVRDVALCENFIKELEEINKPTPPAVTSTYKYDYSQPSKASLDYAFPKQAKTFLTNVKLESLAKSFSETILVDFTNPTIAEEDLFYSYVEEAFIKFMKADSYYKYLDLNCLKPEKELLVKETAKEHCKDLITKFLKSKRVSVEENEFNEKFDKLAEEIFTFTTTKEEFDKHFENMTGLEAVKENLGVMINILKFDFIKELWGDPLFQDFIKNKYEKLPEVQKKSEAFVAKKLKEWYVIEEKKTQVVDEQLSELLVI